MSDPSGRVVVLCYHSIHPSKSFASATPDLFDQHLGWLKENCDVVPFSQILNQAKTPKSNGPTVAITFDDGYADNYEYAFPLLKRWRIPATFFVTVGLLEKDAAVVARFRALRHNASYDDIRPLDWSEAVKMLKEGMEFGSHTYSHPNLAPLDRASAEWEVKFSKELMENRLNQSITMMAYPFGKPKRHFSKDTMAILVAAGYERAAAIMFRSVRECESRYTIPRFFVTGDSLNTLKAKVWGSWDFLGHWQEKSPLWLARIVSPKDFTLGT
jgi:peptidoglycan/xylan/chitin deacetylase (PgdA/CDA1 family)